MLYKWAKVYQIICILDWDINNNYVWKLLLSNSLRSWDGWDMQEKGGNQPFGDQNLAPSDGIT